MACAIALLAFVLCLFPTRARAQSELLLNPGFEGEFTPLQPASSGAISPQWSLDTSGATFYLSKDTTNIHSGSSAQKIELTSLPTGSWLNFKQVYAFQKGHTYRGTIWLRSSDAVQVVFYFRRAGAFYEAVAGHKLTVGPNWTPVTIEGGFGDDVPTFFGINFQTTGTLWIDDGTLTDITETSGVRGAGPIPATLFGMHTNQLGTHFNWPPANQGIYRLWDSGVTWAHIEPTKGAWNWTRFDLYVNTYIKANNPNCEIIYCLGQTPTWARPEGTTTAAAPVNIVDWRDYVRTVATRYRGKIKYYELWNETDQSQFYRGTKAQMLEMLIAAREELHAVDPSIVILSPNITRSGLLWLDEFLSLGAAPYFDIVSFHKYLNLSPEQHLGEYHGLRDLLTHHGIASKPIWNTEGAAAGSVPPTDAEARATVARAYLTMWIAGISNYDWYMWDSYWGKENAVKLSTDNFAGLRPGGIAYREMVGWLKGATMTARTTDVSGTWIVDVTLPSGDSGHIVWNTNGATSFSIPGNWGANVQKDLSGNATLLGSQTSLSIGIEPVLLATVTPPASAPGGLKADAVPVSRVSLTWTDLPNEDSFAIERSTDGVTFAPIATVGADTTTFFDSGLTPNTTYHYRVRAQNAVAQSPYSSVVSVTAPQEIIKDNTDASGILLQPSINAWSSSSSTAGYYGSTYLHDGNTGNVGGKSVRFTPTMPSLGNYEVYLRWTSDAVRASNALVEISHAGGTTSFRVNQRLNGGTWFLLGTYTFNAGTAGHVTIRNDGADGFVIADAVDFLPVPSGPTPATPASFSATVASSSQINLAWAPSTDATSYRLKRATTSGGPYSIVATGLTGTTYSDVGLTGSTTYYYVVSAANDFAESTNSSQVSAPTHLAIPTSLTATAGNYQVSLSWAASNAATSYNLKRATTSGGPYVTIASLPGTSFVDTGLANGTTYYYVVSAVNGTGETGNSFQTATSTFPNTPAPPAGLTATALGVNRIDLAWKAPFGAASYHVKRALTSGGPYTSLASGITGTSYSDTSVTNGTTYYYVVSAVNIGESGNSAQATATAQPVFINRARGGTASAFASQSTGPASLAFDGTTSKWYSGGGRAPGWLQYDFGAGVAWAVTRYDLQSGNDVPQRDPMNWEFQGSQDGIAWTTLDTRSGESFSARLQTKQYSLSNTTAYRYYRLYITANAGGSSYGIQIAELSLMAWDSAPVAPASLTATPASSSQIDLAWTATGGSTGYKLKRSHTSGGPYALVASGLTATNYSDAGLTPGSTYYYVVSAANDLGEGPNSPEVAASTPKVPASVTLSNLNHVYDGSSKAPSVTTDPVNLAVSLTYNGSSMPPVNAGSYTVSAIVNDPIYTGSTTSTLTIAPAPASVTLSSLSQTYDGASKPVVATTAPANLAVNVTYDGSTAAPTNAGSYAVVAAVADPNYMGSATGTLVIAKANAAVTLNGLSVTYDGTPKSVTATTSPAGLPVTLTYNGTTASPSNAGSYAVSATVNHANYTGSATGTLTIAKATATIVLAPLTQRYDGAAKPVTATTTPSGLTVNLTYGGATAAPIYPGSHAVEATIDDPNYTGTKAETLTITITALVRHAPTLDGILDGSAQIILPENVTFNGSASVSGDLLVPGLPTVNVHSQATYVSTIDATGSATPAGHIVTLNSGAVLRHIVRRVDAIAMPIVSAPPAPGGTRDVSINNGSESVGDFATLRNLTLGGSAGSVTVPSGTYGALAAGGSTSLVLGVVGATEPAVYNLQSLTLNGGASLQIVGPVVINLAKGPTLNGQAGTSAHPDWLVMQVASENVTVSPDTTLNGNVVCFGTIIAPTGSVTINGSAAVYGRVVADRLILNGNGLLSQNAP